MGVSGRRRWAISPVTVAVIPIAIGLIGNLATNTVQVKAGWWVPLTWTATGLLVLAALVGQVAQSRGGDESGQGDSRALLMPAMTIRRWDPIALGVHPAIALDERAVVPGLSPQLPTYVQRDHDRLLRRLLEHPESPVFVMLVGTSSAGKTRSALEAVKSCLPDWQLLYPLTVSDLLSSLEAGVGSRTIVWLNESQTYLDGSKGEAAAAAVRRLLASTTQVVVIGSMWPQYWFTYAQAPRPGTPDPHRQVRALLESATKVTVPDAFAPDEMASVQRLAESDPRLASALMGLTQGYGVTQTLAGGPDLVSRWENAPDAYSRAVIHAAADARRLGHLNPLPAELLHELGASMLSGPQRAAAPAGWFDDALAYACGRVRGDVSLLTATSRVEGRTEGYLLADFIDQYGREARRCAMVSDAMWRALAVHATDPDDLERIGMAALVRGRYYQALELWRAALDLGGISAAAPLRQLLIQMGMRQELEKVLRRAADSGDAESRALLLALLRRANRTREVEQVLRQATAGGDGQSCRDLAVMLYRGGREEEAEHLLRSAVEQGDRAAGRLLAILLQRSGETVEAAQVKRGLGADPLLLPARREGHTPAQQTSDRETHAAPAFPEALAGLLGLLKPKVEPGKAERLLREMATGKITNAFGEQAPRLVKLLGGDELRDQAIEVLDNVRNAPGKDVDLARLLSILLIRADRRTEAESLLRQLADHDYRALTDLVELLTRSGRREECVPLVQAAISTYGAKAKYLLATVQRALGRIEEADRLLRSAADEGVDEAIQGLVRQLLAEGSVQEAMATVRRASRAGRSDSSRAGAVHLYNAGHKEESLDLLRDAAICGNAGALRLIIALLERMSRTEEAAAVTRTGLASDGSTLLGQIAD